jgi:hypothetical protein
MIGWLRARWARHVHFFRSHENEGSGPWWLTAEWHLNWMDRDKDSYLGTILKGWWTLGPKHTRDSCEVEVAVGGEDNCVQVGVAIPWLARCYVGVRVPRSWTKGWVYERREWAIMPGYIGHLCWLRFARDEQAEMMRDYYTRKGHDLASYVPTRAALWPGWEVQVNPRWRDRVFGRRVYESKDVTDRRDRDYTVLPPHAAAGSRSAAKEPLAGIRTSVPMPEGNYPCIVKLTEDTWTRPRLKAARKLVRRAEVEMLVPIPVPGKGTASYNCDDDATYSMCCTARSVAQAVATMAESAMRDRERYANRNWQPREGFDKEVARG